MQGRERFQMSYASRIACEKCSAGWRGEYTWSELKAFVFANTICQDPRKHIADFSNQFQRDFLQLLRTSHVEKAVHMNHFYQTYIANKEQ